MSTRLRLSDVKADIARVLGVCESDSRVVSYLNEAQRRLMPKGKWVGTVVRYRICVHSSCLSWPRQVETIEAFSVCDWPGTIRNHFYEFLGNGPGQLTEDDMNGRTLVDRGMAATFDDPIATAANKIRVHASVSESSSSRILIQGYDDSAQWVRTLDSGSWVDGEYVTISTTYQYTTTRWSNITGIQKPITNGPVWLYEYSTTSSTAVKALAYYEPDEQNPWYRRSLIPNLSNTGCCDCSSDDDCTNTTVTVLAKLRHIPVRTDNDWLVLQSLPALKDMAKSVDFREKNLLAEAMAYEASAVAELQADLSSHQGSGTVVPIRAEHWSTFGGGGIEPVVSGHWNAF